MFTRYYFSVDFANELKQTFKVKLPSMELSFDHFLLPLPWKPEVEKHKQFFSHLWTWVLTSERFVR